MINYKQSPPSLILLPSILLGHWSNFPLSSRTLVPRELICPSPRQRREPLIHWLCRLLHSELRMSWGENRHDFQMCKNSMLISSYQGTSTLPDQGVNCWKIIRETYQIGGGQAIPPACSVWSFCEPCPYLVPLRLTVVFRTGIGAGTPQRLIDLLESGKSRFRERRPQGILMTCARNPQSGWIGAYCYRWLSHRHEAARNFWYERDALASLEVSDSARASRAVWGVEEQDPNFDVLIVSVGKSFPH